MEQIVKIAEIQNGDVLLLVIKTFHAQQIEYILDLCVGLRTLTKMMPLSPGPVSCRTVLPVTVKE